MQLVDVDRSLSPQPDPGAIEAFLSVVMRPGDVHELRIPKIRQGARSGVWGVGSGYFDNVRDAVDWLEDIDGRVAEGIYVTINPVDPDLLARAHNRLQFGRPVTTTDADIVCRRHLLLDLDPTRKSGISSTDAERDLAMARAREVIQILTDAFGWPPPVMLAMTGNGAAVLYRVALGNDEPGHDLVDRVLRGVGVLADDDQVTVDTTVKNAARIGKVIGTVAAKGDSLPDRPHRLATAELNAGTLPVPVGALEAVASLGLTPVPRSTTGTSTPVPGASIADRLPGLLDGAGIGYTVKPRSWGTTYALDRCLTSTDHTDGAALHSFPSGAVSYRCHHARCQGRGWADVRDQLGAEPARAAPVMQFPSVSTAESGRSSQAAKPATTAAKPLEKMDVTLESLFEPAPEAAYYGMFRDYIDIVGHTTEGATEYHLMAALVVAGAINERRTAIVHASDMLYGNLYGLAIGRSGAARKDTCLKRVLSISELNLDLVGMQREFVVRRDVSSAEGLIGQLEKHPNVVLYLTEFSTFLKNAARQSTSTIKDRVIELFDAPESIQNLSKGDPRIAVRPFLSMMAATQPGRFTTGMTEEDLLSGFGNRLLPFTGRGRGEISDPPELDRRRAWDWYTGLRAAIRSYPEGMQLRMDAVAKERFGSWYHQLVNEPGRDETEDAMRQRHPILALKVGLLFAITDQASAIEDRHLAAAIALVEWSWSEMRKLMGTMGAGIDSQIEAAIIRCLTKHQVLKRRDVQRLTSRKAWGPKDFAGTFEAMVRNGTIEMDGEGHGRLSVD